jgi:hypothetical protein
MDSLNSYTRKFIGLLLQGSHGKDLERCKKMLDSLMSELKRRRQKSPVDHKFILN